MKIINGGIFTNLCQHLGNSKNTKNNDSSKSLFRNESENWGRNILLFPFF